MHKLQLILYNKAVGCGGTDCGLTKLLVITLNSDMHSGADILMRCNR